MHQANPAVPQRVRREVRHSGVATSTLDSHPKPICGDATEQRCRRVAILPSRQTTDDSLEEIVREANPPGAPSL